MSGARAGRTRGGDGSGGGGRLQGGTRGEGAPPRRRARAGGRSPTETYIFPLRGNSGGVAPVLEQDELAVELCERLAHRSERPWILLVLLHHLGQQAPETAAYERV